MRWLRREREGCARTVDDGRGPPRLLELTARSVKCAIIREYLRARRVVVRAYSDAVSQSLTTAANFARSSSLHSVTRDGGEDFLSGYVDTSHRNNTEVVYSRTS